MSRARLFAAAVLVPVAVAAAACDQTEMRDQPRREAYEAAPDLPGGTTALVPPEGTVARDALTTERPPQPPVSLDLLERGRTMFGAICSPCHGLVGNGDGMVVQRGFPSPPSFHLARLRQAPDTHFYRVISRGYGLMYDYANRVGPEDRWAVIAYIRALQLSQYAEAAALPEALRERLPRPAGAGP